MGLAKWRVASLSEPRETVAPGERRTANEQMSKKLDGVEYELRNGNPLHFVLNVKKHGMLGASRWPGAEMDWKRMASIGFQWVICACSEDPGYDPFPLKFLTSTDLTDLSRKGQPDDPAAEFEQIAAIASQAFLKLNEGGILVHCAGGRGRTGTIIGAILRHCGYGGAEVICFLDSAYRDAGRPGGWPESPWQSQVVERIKLTGDFLGEPATS
jgi:hypothetical protein